MVEKVGILDPENEKPADAGLFGSSGDNQLGYDTLASTPTDPHSPGSVKGADLLSPRIKNECHALATA